LTSLASLLAPLTSLLAGLALLAPLASLLASLLTGLTPSSWLAGLRCTPSLLTSLPSLLAPLTSLLAGLALLAPLASLLSLSSLLTLLSPLSLCSWRLSPLSSLSLGLDALDALEEHDHLLLADLAVTVLVALLGGLPDLLLVLGRSHTHVKADILVGVEELGSLELSALVGIILLEGSLDGLLESLVVSSVPSS
jgi:hypothetical protein